MNPIFNHYNKLLAARYTWMFGDYNQKVAKELSLFQDLKFIADPAANRALDLGCGSGFQSVALAQLGYAVLALDSSIELLNELDARSQGLSIEARCQDIRDFSKIESNTIDLVVCMGDTLSHLASESEIVSLFQSVLLVLKAGGRMILGFRDQTSPPTPQSTFIVRSDESRIMTCCLDYAEQTIFVTDLFHEKDGDGWKVSRSVYPKYRLRRDAVVEILAKSAFLSPKVFDHAGMTILITSK